MGDPDRERQVSPQALRALAHPLRWRLLDVLEAEDSATATRCARLTGESVASCAYHLGILAKYGYAEQQPDAPGREKPWRLVSRRQDLSSARLDAEGALAAEAAEAFLDHELVRLKNRLREADLQPPQWRPWLRGATTVLTATEYLHLKEQVEQTVWRLMEEYADRDTDPARRPADGRQVRLFIAASAALSGTGDSP
jgi:Helix-turn-helix domain